MKSIEVSDEVYEQAKMLANVSNLSVERFAAELVKEQAGMLRLQERARRGSLEKLKEVLAKVSDCEPEAYDKL